MSPVRCLPAVRRQIAWLFVTAVACSLGYLSALLYCGLQYGHTINNSNFDPFVRLPRTIRAALDVGKLGGTNAELSRGAVRHPLVKWRLFGKEFMTDDELRNISRVQEETATLRARGGVLSYFGLMRDPKATTTDKAAPLDQNLSGGGIKSVSRDFQHKLESSWPLDCRHGNHEEGLFLKKYERFFKALQDYVDFHRSTSPTNFVSSAEGEKARVLVWQCSVLDFCGGLADRMKGVTYALLLSMFSRRRLIINWDDTYVEPNLIDWRDDVVYGILKGVDKYVVGNVSSDSDQKPVPDSSQHSNDQDVDRLNEGMSIEIEADYAREEIYDKLGKLSEYPYLFRMFSVLGGTGIENSESDIISILSTIGGPSQYVILSANLEPHTLKDSYKNGNQEWIKDGLKWVGLDHLSMDDVDNTVGIVLRYLFRLKSSLLVEVANAGHALALSGQLYTSLHIRTGFAGSAHLHETVKHPKLIRNKHSWESRLKCVVKKANSLLGPTSPILLATDSRIVKHMAVSKYGGRFRTLDNSLSHIDKMDKIPHTLEGSELEGVVFTWVDMLLLAESHVQVGGTSGYAWAASLLCSLPSHRRINAKTCNPGHNF